MSRLVKPAIAAGSLLVVILTAGCGQDNDTYTLYRSSAMFDYMRLHVASFDTKDGESYNRENCDIARGLFAAQPGVSVRYWCENGRYKS